MKNHIVAFLASCLVWYGIISFITWNINLSEWHWVDKIFYIVFVFLTYGIVMDKK